MPRGHGGKRLVVAMYLIIVGFTGVAGYLAALVIGDINAPRFLFLFELPATPFGLAAFGMLTIGFLLGTLLVAVAVVSERIDDPHRIDEDAP